MRYECPVPSDFFGDCGKGFADGTGNRSFRAAVLNAVLDAFPVI